LKELAQMEMAFNMN